MSTFEELDRHLGLLPPDLVNALTEIDCGRGYQDALRGQHPMVLESLKTIAIVQSVEASNAIEDIHVPHKRLRELALGDVTPENRSEAEVAGYRRVLKEIHENGENIPLRLNVVLQLHGWLFSFLDDRGGQFKIGENRVVERHPDGSEIVRLDPVSAADTPRYMRELHRLFDEAGAERTYHPLLLLGAYVFDFLMIHPFQDGNGRMSRLITSLLMRQGGYEVGRYISWEKKINDTREVYHQALQRSTAGWHEAEHDLHPWLSYFLGILVASYADFAERAKLGTGRGAAMQTIERFLRANLSDRFTIADIREILPTTSDVHIGRLLRQLKDRGIIEPRGGGRGAYWMRLPAGSNSQLPDSELAGSLCQGR
jgi:Fic family protein